MTVLLRSEIDCLPFDLDSLRQTAEQLMGYANLNDKELSILLVSDDRIAELNEAYRHKNKPTNVLSFPMFDNDHPTGVTLLGDIVISIDTASREASVENIPIENYLAILLVHGLSHLLGYDHERAGTAAEEMASFEKELLTKLTPEYNNPLTN